MYASVIGKMFLEEYNRSNNTNFSAKSFFEKAENTDISLSQVTKQNFIKLLQTINISMFPKM